MVTTMPKSLSDQDRAWLQERIQMGKECTADALAQTTLDDHMATLRDMDNSMMAAVMVGDNKQATIALSAVAFMATAILEKNP